MAYCVKCGARVDDDLRFCPYCGAEVPRVGKTGDTGGNTYTSGESTQNNTYSSDTYTFGGSTGGAQGYTYYQGENGSGQNSSYYQSGTGSSQTYNDPGRGNYNGNSGYQSTGYFEPYEVKRNKAMGVLSYLGILVLIPLLAGDRTSAYVKHHINQGLMLFIVSSIVDILDGNWLWSFRSWFTLGGSWLSWIIEIADFACLILLVMGIISACKGTRQEFPVIGKIKILK